MTKLRCNPRVVSLAVIALAGCSGGDEPSATFRSADAERLAAVGPSTPGWPAWPQEPEARQPSDSTPEELAAKDPIYAAYRRSTADVEQRDEWGSGNHWEDDDKLANVTVGVFETEADAHTDFVASNVLSRAYGAKYGFVVRAEKIDGLGDEAWRLWTHGNGAQVTYHWRRENLVTEVHIHCFGDCPSADTDVDTAARAWADAIDWEARSG